MIELAASSTVSVNPNAGRELVDIFLLPRPQFIAFQGQALHCARQLQPLEANGGELVPGPPIAVAAVIVYLFLRYRRTCRSNAN